MHKYDSYVENNSDNQQTAIIDLECGQVHGCKGITIPTEAGITFYNENMDSASYSSKEFVYDVDLVQWKPITDEYGNKIETICSVANMKRNEYNKPRDKEFKLDINQEDKAYQIDERAHRDLNHFINHMLKINDVGKLIFFDKSMEMKAFEKANIDLKDYVLVDVQKEIKKKCNIEQGLSLDRISQAIDFYNTERKIKSSNFEYEMPNTLKHLIKPHRALGDSARTFLVYKEFNLDENNFKRLIKKHLELAKAVQRMAKPISHLH
jgi:hypothetical protein